MSSKHAFWVIVDGNTPTAFRSPRREDLLAVLHQLQRTQPRATLKWFDRGRLWESPVQAREDMLARRRAKPDRRPDWRPGGSHVDPRAKYQLTRDQKRARFKQRSRGGAPAPPAREGGPGPVGPGQPPAANRPFLPKPSGQARGPYGSGSYQGRRGPQGPRSSQGPRDFRGPRDAQGHRGPRAPKGPKSPGGPGFQRPRGPRGPRPPRRSGPRGPRGPKGGR